MRLHHVHGVDIIEQVDFQPFCLTKQPRGKRFFVHHEFGIDVLTPIDHITRLQALGVQPSHVHDE